MEDLEIGGRVETIQTTTWLRTARILRRVLETWGDLLSLKLQWKTISVSWCGKAIIIMSIIFRFVYEMNLEEKSLSLDIYSRSQLNINKILFLYPHILTRTGCNTKSIFKRSTVDLNSEFPFSWTRCHTKSVLLFILFTNPSARVGYDTRSIFKRSLTGLNSEFFFSLTSCLTKAEELSLSYYLPIAGGRIIGFIPFPRVLVLCEIQSVSSRIWTRFTVSIFYDDNHYTTGTSLFFLFYFIIYHIVISRRDEFMPFHRALVQREIKTASELNSILYNGLVSFGFMAHQTWYVIQCQIHFLHINNSILNNSV